MTAAGGAPGTAADGYRTSAEPMTAVDLDALDAALEDVREGVGLHALIEHARRNELYCCSVGCGSGACETCPCCGAGWCISGFDGLPEHPDDLATWLEVAAEYNPIAAALLATRGEGA